jgi:hypothetical protein
LTTQHQAPEVTRPIDRELTSAIYRHFGFNGGTNLDLSNPDLQMVADRFTRATQPLSLTVDWPADAEFQLGDLVQKKGRASWRGHVRGWYRTELTELGYAVESMYEPGSVQIYPASALDRLQFLSLPVDIDRSGLAQEVE